MTTAVVIGHGPSATGRGWGQDIDRAETVIRMFDCAWQGETDYGTKFDIGVVTMAKRSLQWFETEATRKPEKWWLYRQDGVLIDVKTQAPQEIFDVAEYQQTAIRLGARTEGAGFALTRGTATACQAIKALQPDRLVLVGFDEVRAGTFSTWPYSSRCLHHMSTRPEFAEIVGGLSERTGDQTRSLGHDLGVEMAVIATAARDNGVEVVHAQEVW